MYNYDIFANKSGKLKAVKQGWSWPALFFGAAWAFCNGLWKVGLITSLVSAFIGAFSFMLGATPGGDLAGAFYFVALFSLLTCIIFGANGNIWRRERLALLGYSPVDVVISETPAEALEQYKSRRS